MAAPGVCGKRSDRSIITREPRAGNWCRSGVAAGQHHDRLCGFNVLKYDLRVLSAELRRVGRTLPIAGRAIIDPLVIYHARERRDLTAALRFYCDRGHDGVHGAEADVLATIDILDAQVTRYHDLPRTIAELHAHTVPASSLDLEGNFLRDDAGRVVFGFGKYRGHALADIAADPRRRDYLDWILTHDFLDDTKAIVRTAMGEAMRVSSMTEEY
jgi:DNA polymerase-3 subunit epsilon